MRHCKKCAQPDTRPKIYFNEEDICGAYEKRFNEIFKIMGLLK